MSLKKKVISLLVCSILFLSQLGMVEASVKHNDSFDAKQNAIILVPTTEDQAIIPCIGPNPWID